MALALSALFMHAHAAGTSTTANPRTANPRTANDEIGLLSDLPSVNAASRYDQPTSEAPASVSLVTAQDIERHGYRTLGDILNSVRGFTLSSDRNYSYIGVRGFERAGDYNSRILVLLDGHRLNDNVYEDVGYGYDGLVDVSLIDRVEVVRGPSSSLYGTSAFFAVVNIVTKRGRDVEGTVFGIAAGGNRSSELRAMTGRRLDNGLEYILSMSGYGSRGEQDLYYPEFDAPVTGFGRVQNGDGERARRAFLKIRHGDFSFEGAFSQRHKTVPTAAYGTVFGDTRYRTVDERAFLAVRHDTMLSPVTELHSRISWNSMQSTGDYPFDLPPIEINHDRSKGRWWMAETSLNTFISEAHRLTVGADYKLNSVISQYNADIVQHLDDHRRSSQYGLFVQDEWRLSKRVILNAGARHDRYSDSRALTSPRLGLIFKVEPETTLKFLMGRAFRAPNAYERYYNDGNVTQGANPALAPERINTTEFVFEHAFSPRLQSTVNLYQYRLKNLIRQMADPVTGVLVFQNVDRVRTNGLELEMAWRGTQGGELRFAYARQHNRDELTGVRIASFPAWTAKFQGAMPVAGERVTLATAARYVSQRTSLAGAPIAGAWVADLKLQVTHPALPGTRFHATAYNVLNRRYADPGALEHTQNTIPQNGRNFWLGAEHRF